jgi:Ca2+:H+ antiporter
LTNLTVTWQRFDGRERITLLLALGATILTIGLRYLTEASLPLFAISALALAGLAALVGDATDQLGSRFGPGATGVLQSGLGNLPELFISIFALRAGLVGVVQGALVGSVLANSLLVLGIAFVAGGLKHGVQRFGAMQSRTIAVLTVLSVSALMVPTLAAGPSGPDVGHADALSLICAIVLFCVFLASLPSALKGAEGAGVMVPVDNPWPLTVTVVVLVFAGIGAAFASACFVQSLQPVMIAFGLSEEFVGLVFVAIIGNAVENVVGVQMSLRNLPDFSVSLILNSSLQVTLALTPVLVILSHLIGGATLTLVLPPLLIASLFLAALLSVVIVYDGESTWLEGIALIGLYIIIASSFWWGAPA